MSGLQRTVCSSASLGRNDVCARCEKDVPVCHAVKRGFASYHHECIYCETCRARLENTATLKEDNDGFFYCLDCYFALPPERKRKSPTPSASANKWGGVQYCAVCDRPVYAREMRSWGSKVYHRANCFRCQRCEKQLDDSTVADKCVTEPLCRPCWNKQRSDVPTFAVQKSTCAVCEQECQRLRLDTVEVDQKLYHRACLHCFTCGTVLDSTRLIVADGKMYCRPCHHKQVPSRTKSPNVLAMRCAACEGDASIHEIVRILGAIYHTRCLYCAHCSKKVDCSTLVEHEDKMYCRGCHTRLFKTSTSPVNSSKYGGCMDKCASCNKACYPAERVQIKSLVFHIKCIRCSKCNVQCTVPTVALHNNKLYCTKLCYMTFVSLPLIGQKPSGSTAHRLSEESSSIGQRASVPDASRLSEESSLICQRASEPDSALLSEDDCFVGRKASEPELNGLSESNSLVSASEELPVPLSMEQCEEQTVQ